jgi:hypothetical protein
MKRRVKRSFFSNPIGRVAEFLRIDENALLVAEENEVLARIKNKATQLGESPTSEQRP